MKHPSYFAILRPSLDPETSRTAMSDTSTSLEQIKSQRPYSTAEPLQYLSVTTDHNIQLASVTSLKSAYLQTPSFYTSSLYSHSARGTQMVF